GLVPRPPAFHEPVPRARSPLLEIRNLCHRYPDGRDALVDVTLSIGEGEFVALIGRNGSGKTTLAKHLNGLLAPTAGSVRLEGREVAFLPLEQLQQERMLELLARLHATGRTIVIVTHTPWVIATHARRVVLLAEGRLRYDGPLRPFFANEELLAAAAFRAPDVTRLGRCLGC